ncbi:unnamed protein product [Prunus armeniaca]|uniref:H(+)-transporting two-sector ATPase n=1 Tax=Prunus armeniaca TaxID=36596 RepID=A0A6J5X4U6_PRUAR|nr:unnamed protein product [Prunus armeniaca]
MGIDELNEDDKLTVARARKIQRFLSQPFHVVEVFTGAPGKYVELKESIISFQVSLPPLSLSVLYTYNFPLAIDGLLRVHKRIIDGLDGDSSHAPLGMGGKVSTRLLVAASQAGSLIGKQGGTVKSIEESSNCIVRVLGAGNEWILAMKDETFAPVAHLELVRLLLVVTCQTKWTSKMSSLVVPSSNHTC